MHLNYIRTWRLAALSLFCTAGLAVCALADSNVLTGHNDNSRTGLNTNEVVLTPANVNTNTFGKIFTYSLDGYVYAQPLIVTNVTIPGKGVHNVVYVVTEHDSVYALDADDNSGSNAVPLWQTSFINLAAGITSVSSSDPGCGDLVPEIGCTATPVIDPVSGTIYVEAKTKQVTNNVTTFFHNLHALDITTGAEKPGSPALVQPTVGGTGDGNNGHGSVPFDPLHHMDRPALLLNNGAVYVSYASHCDIGPYHGWVVGFDATTLAFTNVFNGTPNGGLGGVWQSGGGLCADTNGYIYFMTGNGTFDGPTNHDYADSFLKLSATNGLNLLDYFTPYNQQDLANKDNDLGAGGTMLLPDSAGSAAHQHLLIGGGKEGTLYLVDRDGPMGHFNPLNDSNDVETLYFVVGGLWSSPAYFNNHIYYQGSGDALKAFPISNASLAASPDSQSGFSVGFPGSTPSISANGTANGIVWTIQSDAYGSSGPEVLHACNAANVSQELYNSSLVSGGTRDNPGGAVKFTVPTVANGKVYVGAQYALSVFGLGTFLPAPSISPNGGIFTNSISVTITDAVSNTAIYYTLDGSTPTTNSIPYTGMFMVTNSLAVRAGAFMAGAVNSGVAVASFLSSASIGNGTGLFGAYYSNQPKTFANPPTITRVDPTVDYDWGNGSPDPAISDDHFTARWTGTVQAQFSEPYTFYTTTDDGVRLWVNGQLVIDEWIDQAPTEWNGSILLAAGQKYPITMEYYENGGGAAAHLSWASPSTAKTVIPQSQLFPVFAPSFLPFSSPAQFQLSGLVGEGYVLQGSTNFSNWVSLQTNSPAADPDVVLPTSLFNFSDPGATNFSFRFYRAQQQ